VYACKCCGKTFDSKQAIGGHIVTAHQKPFWQYKKGHVPHNLNNIKFWDEGTLAYL